MKMRFWSSSDPPVQLGMLTEERAYEFKRKPNINWSFRPLQSTENEADSLLKKELTFFLRSHQELLEHNQWGYFYLLQAKSRRWT